MSAVDLASEAAAESPLAVTNRFRALGEAFFTPLAAQPLPDPHWLATSPTCAGLLGNHLAEAAIRRAQSGDFGEIARLLRVLEHPFDDPAQATAQDDADAGFPPDWAQSIAVSCSS